ncbi:protein mono-ADP-ribosyltransferase PARP4-like [Myxocyprinus asiaticus]|uniref:protein mono-ADP-ribosyltransferase PARP4-like n=1 Tax=Myxocyprinus asiaticus TaxID=70543 RepID=UPI0022218232|nr:protein mono-ADP-ribosyltransferase PARP4-like [Myxocyprinus asiaticus]
MHHHTPLKQAHSKPLLNFTAIVMTSSTPLAHRGWPIPMASPPLCQKQLLNETFCLSGVKAHVDILRLVATLLVLQLIRVKKLAEGELLLSLFKLKESQEPTPVHREAVKRAVDWACWADRQYPCVCSRLELGWDWESSTRQLLGFDSPLPFSPLIPVLERHSVIQSCRTWALGEQVYS